MPIFNIRITDKIEVNMQTSPEKAISLVGRLLKEARERGGLSPLERDLVLEKLRGLYEKVLLDEPQEARKPEPGAPAAKASPEAEEGGKKESGYVREAPAEEVIFDLADRPRKDGLDENGMAEAVQRADQEDPGRVTFYVDLDRDTEYDLSARDKGRIVEELFQGDEAAFDAFMTRILRFDDLNEAILHIQDNYRWDPRSEGLGLVVDLLNAKLA